MMITPKTGIGRDADLYQLRGVIGQQCQGQVRAVFHQTKAEHLLEKIALGQDAQFAKEEVRHRYRPVPV